MSQLCTETQLRSDAYRRWCSIAGLAPVFDRENWEYCYVMQALASRGVLRPGARGVGFGVGREPVPAALAGGGCEVTATDQPEAAAQRQGWGDIGKFGGSLEALARPSACPPEVFRERVTFRTVDMRRIDSDLRGFDFVWSCCALEHLGGLVPGLAFVWESLDCLRPGGLAVHTTEFNVLSNDRTLDTPGLALYRERDITDLAVSLRRCGHDIVLNYHLGTGPLDWTIDRWPYRRNPHLKLLVREFVSTSLGLIIRKAAA